MLKIYNTLSRNKEVFTPIEENKVKMYVCGMTVYDYCHIGHARVLVVFDLVYRVFKHLGYDITYIRNITDIDDKIIQRANENEEDFLALTERFISAMHEDADALGVLRPNAEPKATDNIESILSMISTLIEKGFAYAADNGDVYFAVNEFKEYGRLSGKNLEDLNAGERVAVDAYKQNPLDFVLWKHVKPDEPSWSSPWGDGRPGWHIECSAMSTQMLGNHFDIHGGGQDLQFPHHENEIAQSECCTNEKFVNYWMHNGFVRVNEEKMSKSLGNFFTLRDVMKEYKAEEIRYFILASHYRSPLNYSEQQLDNARHALHRLYSSLLDCEISVSDKHTEYQERFEQALKDDFNSAEALAVLFDITREVNTYKGKDQAKANALASTLKKLADVIGLLDADPQTFLQASASSDASEDAEIEALIEKRAQAKKDKNWAVADEVRDQLIAMDISIEDHAGGTRWKRSK
ncbi:MAG: cysteine--tRNA ligase [Gammaproteobacteria bacterium]|nr:cysteine--tRNA ligase [Gammaproteobacteria bacterium]